MTIPPVIYNTSITMNLCDMNSTNNCNSLILQTDRTTNNMILKYRLLRNIDNSFNEIETGESSNVLFLSSYLLYSKIELSNKKQTGSMSVLFLKLSVSDYSTSNQLSYTIYKSACHECTNADNCIVKVF